MSHRTPATGSDCAKSSQPLIPPDFSREELARILEYSPDGLVLLDRAGRVRYLNSAAAQIFERDREAFIGKDFGFPVALGCTSDIKVYRKDGGYRTVELKSIRVAWRDKQEVTLLSVRDISKHQELEARLLRGERETAHTPFTRDISARLAVEKRLNILSEAVKQSLLGTVIVDLEGRVEYVNRKFLQLTGYEEKAVIGKPIMEVARPLGLTIDLGQAAEGAGTFTTQHLKSLQGDPVWIDQYISVIRTPDGQASHFLVTQDDVTQHVQLKQQLESRHLVDPLTGLLNKAGLEQRIHDLVESEDQRPLFLFHINIDHFSVINDTCGQAGGDDLLREVARLLHSTAGGEAIVGRLESDTFILLGQDMNQQTAGELSTELLQRTRAHRFLCRDNVFNPTLTVTYIPLAEWQEYESVGALFETLYTASRVAKNRGGDQAFFIESWDEEIRRYHHDTRGISLVHKALDGGLFCLFHQPICPISERAEGHAYELLIRMKSGGGFLSPAEFLPAVEKYKLGYKIDQWVINHALAWLSANPSHLASLQHCSINLSGDSLAAPGLVDYVHARIEQYGIPAEKLCFEITETAAVQYFDIAKAHLSRLRGMGCKIALDDFGTGMSSFSYLKCFDIDYLKIDGAFIRDLKHDSVDFAMVKAMHDLGRQMGMKTIAEYVEDEETLNILRLLGIDYVQGFYKGKPAFLC